MMPRESHGSVECGLWDLHRGEDMAGGRADRRARRTGGDRRDPFQMFDDIITVETEHKSVIDTCKRLQREGCKSRTSRRRRTASSRPRW